VLTGAPTGSLALSPALSLASYSRGSGSPLDRSLEYGLRRLAGTR